MSKPEQKINDIEIDPDKIKRLLPIIIILEKHNMHTRKFTHAQMVKKIQKLIEEEVQCY